jgi:hypothetical protein
MPDEERRDLERAVLAGESPAALTLARLRNRDGVILFPGASPAAQPTTATRSRSSSRRTAGPRSSARTSPRTCSPHRS